MAVESLLALLAVIGVSGGFLSGLLGVGGGFLFVPALYFCLGVWGYDGPHAMHMAVGTSLAVMLATGGLSAFGHHRRGAVDAGVFFRWTPFIVFGVATGTLGASYIDSHVLFSAFALMTLGLAVYMASGGTPAPDRSLPLRVQRVLSFCIGWIAALVGIGGAVLSVPLMIWSSVPMKRAVGTAAAMGLAVAGPGMLAYMMIGRHVQGLPPFSVGFVNLAAVATVVPFALFAAPLGVRVAHGISPAALRRVFAALLLAVSAKMFYSLARGEI